VSEPALRARAQLARCPPRAPPTLPPRPNPRHAPSLRLALAPSPPADNNTVYSTNGANCAARGGPFSTFAEFQSKGYESGPPSTVVTGTPSADTMAGWIRGKLFGGAAARVAEAARAA
jgi:hypothetical protein